MKKKSSKPGVVKIGLRVIFIGVGMFAYVAPMVETIKTIVAKTYIVDPLTALGAFLLLVTCMVTIIFIVVAIAYFLSWVFSDRTLKESYEDFLKFHETLGD